MLQFILVFIFGTMIGSFLNVCIHRLPKSASIVWPGSHCPHCGKPIRWFDNVPLVSFILLRAKCRDCGAGISARYFVVELLAPLSGVILLWRYGAGTLFGMYWLLFCALIVIVFIDIEHGIVPDILSLPGIALGVLLSAFLKNGAHFSAQALFDSLLGIVIGGGSMFLLGVLGEMVFKREALGGGDVKLLAMIGAFTGWKLALLTFFISPVLGAGFAFYLKYTRKVEIVPYAPYIVLGAFVSAIYGEEIIRYLFPVI